VEQIPLFEDRPVAVQLIGGIVVPMLFGLLTGFALAWNEVAYLVLVGPVGIIGGLLAGTEHKGADEGFVRGLIGGLVFSSFILLGLEIMNDEPKAEIPEPQAGLVFFITLVSGGLGALGGAYRARFERHREGRAAGA
jgi:hypothetical protein